MDISKLSRYPVSEPFVFDDGTNVSVTWDANYFTKSSISAFDAQLVTVIESARAPISRRLSELKAELAELDQPKRAKGKKTLTEQELAQIEARAKEIGDELSGLTDAYAVAVEDATRTVFATELAEKVLMGWGFTSDDKPLAITAEVLQVRPSLFLRDLYDHCRESSLPKQLRLARARASLMTAETMQGG